MLILLVLTLHAMKEFARSFKNAAIFTLPAAIFYARQFYTSRN